MNDQLHTTVIAKILERFKRNDGQRAEALNDFLLLREQHFTPQPTIAEEIPRLPLTLQCKWATLFANRLFETVAQEQIQELCMPDENNNASLCLLFLLFMESKRMEKQIDMDLELWKTKQQVTASVFMENADNSEAS